MVTDVFSSPTQRRHAVFLALHFFWGVLSYVGAVYYLQHAASSPDIMDWLSRISAAMVVGLLGSYIIQIAWLGRSDVSAGKSTLIWFAVLMLNAITALPLALVLIPV